MKKELQKLHSSGCLVHNHRIKHNKYISPSVTLVC